MPGPSFLDLPSRPCKPRQAGLSCAIDGGLPVDEVRSLLAAASDQLDLWKLGWGTAYLDQRLHEKLSALRDHAVLSCPGGTLLEIATLQDVAEQCLEWIESVGFDCIEVSDGLDRLDGPAKAKLIARASRRCTVVAEVGVKDPSTMMTAATWVALALADLEAGATWVIAEGRESGTVGIYDPDGSVRVDVVDALLDHVGPERIIFEAPRKDQQAWFIRHYGPEVNLANVAPRELCGLEALRLGLRADTVWSIHDQRVAHR